MQLFSRKEAAEFLRISLRKLDALAAEGKLRYSKIGPGKRARVLYRQEDLDNFINRHLSMKEEEIQSRAGRILGGIR
jgi:excisionase family DNA binding protein